MELYDDGRIVALGIPDAVDAALGLVLSPEYGNHLTAFRISQHQAAERRPPEALESMRILVACTRMFREFRWRFSLRKAE
jgi:hypothetical protein